MDGALTASRSSSRTRRLRAPRLDAVEAWLLSQPAYGPFRVQFLCEAAPAQTFLDTDDWSLYRAGLRLAMSPGEDKSSGRLESIGDRLDYLLESSGQDDLSARLSRVAGNKALRPLFRIETKRRSYTALQDGDVVAVIHLDRSRVATENGSRDLQQVELEELQSGSLQRLEPLVDALSDACGLVATDISQFREALGLTDASPETAFNFGYKELMVDASTSEYAYAKLRQLFTEFLTHEPGTKLGEDPEELHQMRVAARKLRATVRLFRLALAPRFAYLMDELRWIAGILGDVRDLDVQEQWLGETVQESPWGEAAALNPLLGEVREKGRLAHQRAVDALESQRYGSFVQAMTAGLREGYDSGDEAALPVRVFAAHALRERYRSVKKQASRVSSESPDSELHQLRIKTKRLRYALETFQPLYGKRQQVMVERTKALQELLGEHQDHAFACDWIRENALRDAATLPPETLIEAGELIERRRQRMAEIRELWPASYRRVEKAWKRAKKELKSAYRDLASFYLDRELTGRATEHAVQRPLSGIDAPQNGLS